MAALHKVVIVGRPNVGKSCLFNRLIKSRRALVHDAPGVTRDLKIERWSIGDQGAELIDTGGLFGETFAAEILRQAEHAIRDADIILFLVDGAQGLVPKDSEIAAFLRTNSKAHVILVVNKIDDAVHEGQTEFYALGYSEILEVSAEHNRGISLLEDAVLARFSSTRPIEAAPELPALALFGRPNSGKSTLMNALLGTERSIVSPIAGTTTDTVNDILRIGPDAYRIMDTAGIRRKSKTEQGIEVLSVGATIRALRECDLAILMIDSTLGIHDQEEKIAGLAEESGTSVILALNKSDCMTPAAMKELREDLWRKLGFLRHAPVVEISALHQDGFTSLKKTIGRVLKDRRVVVDTHALTECVRRENQVHNPRGVKFYYAHQTAKHPPAFVFYVNDPTKVVESLRRHLVNSIRKQWGFAGTPIRAVYRRSGRKPASGATT